MAEPCEDCGSEDCDALDGWKGKCRCLERQLEAARRVLPPDLQRLICSHGYLAGECLAPGCPKGLCDHGKLRQGCQECSNIVTLTLDQLRENADAAWNAGYRAHKAGEQQHSPYRRAGRCTCGTRGHVVGYVHVSGCPLA